MEKVDVRGLSCPIPVIRTKKAIEAGNRDLVILGNTEVSKENVTRLARKEGFTVSFRVDSKDEWEMELKK